MATDTITWANERMSEMREALAECEAYFEQRADAEYFADSASPVGNDEMRLLVGIRRVLRRAA